MAEWLAYMTSNQEAPVRILLRSTFLFFLFFILFFSPCPHDLQNLLKCFLSLSGPTQKVSLKLEIYIFLRAPVCKNGVFDLKKIFGSTFFSPFFESVGPKWTH